MFTVFECNTEQNIVCWILWSLLHSVLLIITECGQLVASVPVWRVFVFRWFTRCRCPQCPGSHFPHFNVKTILSPLPELGSLSWASQPHSDQHPQPHAGMPSSPLMRTLVDFLKLWFLNDKNCVVHFKIIKSTMNFFWLACVREKKIETWNVILWSPLNVTSNQRIWQGLRQIYQGFRNLSQTQHLRDYWSTTHSQFLSETKAKICIGKL